MTCLSVSFFFRRVFWQTTRIGVNATLIAPLPFRINPGFGLTLMLSFKIVFHILNNVLCTLFRGIICYIVPPVKFPITCQIDGTICKISKIIFHPFYIHICQPFLLVVPIHFITGCHRI